MITIQDALRYEIESSPIAGRISKPWLQTVFAYYIAWKTKRKWKRYHWSLTESKRIAEQYKLEIQ